MGKCGEITSFLEKRSSKETKICSGSGKKKWVKLEKLTCMSTHIWSMITIVFLSNLQSQMNKIYKLNKCEKRNGREINFQRQLLHYFSLLSSEARNQLCSILLENKMFLMDGYNELKSSESKSELNISAMGNFLFTAI